MSEALKPLTALGGETPQTDTIGAFVLEENDGIALASVAARLGKESACKEELAKFLSTDIPGVARAEATDEFCIFWMGPDQWMVEAQYNTHELLASELKAALNDTASITEQSDGWCRFDLSGENVTRVLERLCALDTALMDDMSANRTAIEHMGAFVICRKKRQHFSIYGPRSSAHSLHHGLLTAMGSAT